MGVFQIEKDGQVFEIEAPDNITEDQLSVQLQEAGLVDPPTLLGKAKALASDVKEAVVSDPFSPAVNPVLAMLNPRTQEELTQPGFELAGDSVAEGMSESGSNPTLAAGLGTLIKMLPQIASSFAGLGATKEAGKAVTETARKVSSAPKSIAKKTSSIRKAFKETGQKTLNKLERRKDVLQTAGAKEQQQLVKQSGDVAEQVAKRTEAVAQKQTTLKSKVGSVAERAKQKAKQPLETLKGRQSEVDLAKQRATEVGKERLKEAGRKIGEAEKSLGIDQSKTSGQLIVSVAKDTKKLTRFADRVDQLAQLGADDIAKSANPETIQLFRKISEQGVKRNPGLTDITKNKLFGIKKVFSDALGKIDKNFGEALTNYREASKELGKIGPEFNKKKQVLKVALDRVKSLTNKRLARIKEFSSKDRTVQDKELKKLQEVQALIDRKIKEFPSIQRVKLRQLEEHITKAKELVAAQQGVKNLSAVAGKAAIGTAAALAVAKSLGGRSSNR